MAKLYPVDMRKTVSAMMQPPCACGSGEQRRLLKDGYGIPLGYACDRCEAEKLKKFRPDIMTHYLTDEPIEGED